MREELVRLNRSFIMDTVSMAFRRNRGMSLDEFCDFNDRVGLSGYIYNNSEVFDGLPEDRQVAIAEDYVRCRS